MKPGILSLVTALPKLGDSTSEIDSRWLGTVHSAEEEEENKIFVPERPSRWHPSLNALRREITSTKDSQFRSAEITDWRYYDGPYSGIRAVPLRTSKQQALRALAFANAVLLAAEERGVAADIDLQDPRFRLALEGATVHFAVREKFRERVRRVEEGSYPRTVKEGTGKLFIAVYLNRRFDAKSLAESSFRTLEAFANTLYQMLYAGVVQTRERQRSEERERARAAEVWTEMQRLATEREAAAKAEAEAQRLAEAERAKEQALLDEANAWRSARVLRAYLSAVARRSEGAATEAWLAWATAVAERLSPLESRVLSLSAPGDATPTEEPPQNLPTAQPYSSSPPPPGQK